MDAYAVRAYVQLFKEPLPPLPACAIVLFLWSVALALSCVFLSSCALWPLALCFISSL